MNPDPDLRLMNPDPIPFIVQRSIDRLKYYFGSIIFVCSTHLRKHEEPACLAGVYITKPGRKCSQKDKTYLDEVPHIEGLANDSESLVLQLHVQIPVKKTHVKIFIYIFVRKISEGG